MGCTGKTFLSRGSSQQLPLKYQSWVDSVPSSLQKNKLLPCFCYFCSIESRANALHLIQMLKLHHRMAMESGNTGTRLPHLSD